MSADRKVVLSAKNISFDYRISKKHRLENKRRVLDNFSIDLYDQEVLGVLGHNGSGKSSLLKILAGIISPTEGGVWCEKHVKRSLLTLGLGFRPDLSGRDNAILSAMLGGSRRQEAEDRLDSIRSLADIGDYFEQPVKSYSSGMRARLGFATAINTNADILFIDEILSVGDASFKKKALEVMMEKINNSGSVVFVSHSLDQVEKICTRAVLLRRGQLEAEGCVKEICGMYKKQARKAN